MSGIVKGGNTGDEAMRTPGNAWNIGLVTAVCVFALVSPLMAAKLQSLAGSEWRPIEVAGEALPSNTQMFVRFEAENKVAGNGGCNRFMGGYRLENATLRIGPLASTRRACEADVMKREAAFLRALEEARIFLRNGTKLTLKNAQGATTVRLAQTDWD